MRLETRSGACFLDVRKEVLWVVGMSREEFVKVAPSRPQLLAVQQIVTGFCSTH